MFLVIDGIEVNKISIGKDGYGNILTSNDGNPLALKVTEKDKYQILFKDYPHLELDQISCPHFSKDGQHLAYFGYKRNNPVGNYALYIDGQPITIKTMGVALAPNWKSFTSIAQAEGHGFSTGGSQICMHDLKGHSKEGNWYDWISEPKYLNNETVSYIAFDGNTFWQINAKYK